jgi:N6-adenosine-specific RNA methylase IME4
MKYKTVVVDPPWPIKLAPSMNRILQGSQLHETLDYEFMSVDELREFPIDDYADEKSIIFLWCLNSKLENGRPCLQVAFELIEKWGFKFRMTLVWEKSHGYAIWQPFRGLTEFVIFATRGIQNLKPYGRYSNIFKWPITKHSEKPAGFYQMLRAWTPEPRIDLFARRAHLGFDGWGHEYVGEGPLMEFLK